MYGYQNDEPVQGSGVNFGLNSEIRMVKFEYNPNCGKDGTPLEGLDIVFNNGARDINYRQFPVTKAFDGGKEITDPKHPKFQEELNRFNSIITHIMLCFIPRENYSAALSKPIESFKDFCKVLMQLLPDNYSEIELDAFFQYQWQIKGENDKTYLELPKKTNYGKFLCKHLEPVGEWKAIKADNPSDSNKNALYYKDDAGNIHPFVRNGWFMNQPFAKQQKEDAGISDLSTTASDIDSDEGTW